jgi:hypothetical protein
MNAQIGEFCRLYCLPVVSASCILLFAGCGPSGQRIQPEVRDSPAQPVREEGVQPEVRDSPAQPVREARKDRALVIPGGGRPGEGLPTVELDRQGGYYRLNSDRVAAGSAFVVTANDITLDLNGHSVIYNDQSGNTPVYGVYVRVGVDRFTVKNGTIRQGRGASSRSPALYFYGASWVRGPHAVHDLILYTHGDQSGGIVADQGYGFNNSRIFRTYIEVRSDTHRMDGGGAEAIDVNAMNQGGVQIFDNIIVGAHRGIAAGRLGEQRGMKANRSKIYNNRIQHERRKHGNKSSYGIALAGRSHNVHIYRNQIVSDDGRGIILDGLGQGVAEGTSGNAVYDNRIDVQYSSSVAQGAYVENNVYGIRNRYASGDNRYERNQILVTSETNGTVVGVFIGSDARDRKMKNLVFQDNTIVVRPGQGRGSRLVNEFDHTESLTFSNNRFLGNLSSDTSRVVSATISGNSQMVARGSTAPAAPGDLRLVRFLDSYLLEWTPLPDPDVLEYVVYRDGKRLPISPRGGSFYVDRDVRGSHAYSVSALRLSGQEGPRSPAVSTAQAARGWW